MLRGQGSLQQLFGKAFGKPSKALKQQGPASVAIRQEQSVTGTHSEQPTDGEPPRPGHIRCPICRLQLRDDDATVNEHIDGCLTHGGRPAKAPGRRQQTTLLQFASRREHSPAPGAVPRQTTPGSSSQAALAALGAAPAPAAAPASVPAHIQAQWQQQQGQQRRDPVTASDQSSQRAPFSCSPPPGRQAPGGTPRLQQHRPVQLGSPGGLGPATISIPFCLVMGRQHQSGARCPAGQRVVVAWEDGNPRDPLALLATHAGSGAALGHLPSSVARHLGPLVRWQGVVVEGVVLEEPPSEGAPLPVELQITLPSPNRSPKGGKQKAQQQQQQEQKLSAALEAAQAAAAEHAAQRQGTGERLRANFIALLDTVLAHDAHLLDESEKGFARTFQELPPDAAALALRLFLRKGPWFRGGTLSYVEVPDVAAALGTLCAAGLACLVPAAGGGLLAIRTAEEGASTSLVAAAEEGACRTPMSVDVDSPSPRSAGPVAAALAACSAVPEVGPDAVPIEAQGVTAAAAGREAGPSVRATSSSGSWDSGWDDVKDAAEGGDEAVSTACAGLQGPRVAGSSQPREQAAAPPHAACARASAAAALPPTHVISWQELANLLTVPEIGAALARAAGPRAAGGASCRAQLLDAVQAAAGWDEAGVRRALLEATGDVVRLSPQFCEAVNRIQRLFFLNEGHTLSQFLAANLGGVRYPQYRMHRSRSAFASRQALLEYECALRHAEALTCALEDGDFDTAEAALQHAWAALDGGAHKGLSTGGAELPLFLMRFHAGWIYCMVATVGVSLLERQKKYQQAVDRLRLLLGGECCPGRRGEWWVRLVVDTEHLGRPEEALELAEAALADHWLSHGDRLSLQRKVVKLAKPPRRWRKPAFADAASWEPPERRIEGRPINNSVGMKSRFWGLDGGQCSVEELALQYYASEEGGRWRGLHSEGGIWATLFGLLLWEVLFAPSVPDVLRSPFQTAPLDLDTDAFYAAREPLIEGVLGRVAAGEAPTMLEATWQAQHGVLCRGVNWDRYTLEDLQEVAACVGGPGLAAVCRLLAEDHAGWSGGMPDLLLWHPGRCAALLSEVKGPRDRLSDQQRAWMAALAAGGLACEVLKVVEPGAGPKKRKNGSRA